MPHPLPLPGNLVKACQVPCVTFHVTRPPNGPMSAARSPRSSIINRLPARLSRVLCAPPHLLGPHNLRGTPHGRSGNRNHKSIFILPLHSFRFVLLLSDQNSPAADYSSLVTRYSPLSSFSAPCFFLPELFLRNQLKTNPCEYLPEPGSKKRPPTLSKPPKMSKNCLKTPFSYTSFPFSFSLFASHFSSSPNCQIFLIQITNTLQRSKIHARKSTTLNSTTNEYPDPGKYESTIKIFPSSLFAPRNYTRSPVLACPNFFVGVLSQGPRSLQRGRAERFFILQSSIYNHNPL
jgi:hypothetical protein